MINSGFINGMGYEEATAVVIKKLEELGIGHAKVQFKMRDAQDLLRAQRPEQATKKLPHIGQLLEIPCVFSVHQKSGSTLMVPSPGRLTHLKKRLTITNSCQIE